MSKELSQSMAALHDFTQKARAAFPCLPEITVTFPTNEALSRFRTQMWIDVEDTIVAAAWLQLPPGVEAEIEGIRIRLKVRT